MMVHIQEIHTPGSTTYDVIFTSTEHDEMAIVTLALDKYQLRTIRDAINEAIDTYGADVTKQL